MRTIRRLLRGTRTLPGSSFATLSCHGNEVEVHLPSGRKQVVSITRDGEHYHLSSVVVGRSSLEGWTWEELAREVWHRNAMADVVAFAVDDHDRLVGRVQQIADTLQRDELLFYIGCLVRECDRLEFLLRGDDRS